MPEHAHVPGELYCPNTGEKDYVNNFLNKRGQFCRYCGRMKVVVQERRHSFCSGCARPEVYERSKGTHHPAERGNRHSQVSSNHRSSSRT